MADRAPARASIRLECRDEGFAAYVAAVAVRLGVIRLAGILCRVRRAPPDGTGCSRLSVVERRGSFMYVAPPMSHACSAFAVALFVTVWLRARQDWSIRWMAALGASAALMAMVREQDVFFALGVVFDLAIALRKGEGTREKLRSVLAAIAAFALTYLPQLLAYQALNGHPGPSRLVTRKMNWCAPHALQVLGSPEHGFLLWTPLAVLSLAGLAFLAFRSKSQDARVVGRASLIMVALQVYVSGSVESWTVRELGENGGSSRISAVLGGRVGRAGPAGLQDDGHRLSAVGVWWDIALMRIRHAVWRKRLDMGATLPCIVTLPHGTDLLTATSRIGILLEHGAAVEKTQVGRVGLARCSRHSAPAVRCVQRERPGDRQL